MIIPTSPKQQQQPMQLQEESQPQKPKKNSKKTKDSEGPKEKKKKPSEKKEAQKKVAQVQPTPIDANQSDDVQENGYNPNNDKRIEPMRQIEEEHLKNTGIHLPGVATAFGNLDLQSLIKQYDWEQMANIFPNPASLPSAEQYIFGNPMGGINPQDLQRLLGGMMPNRNLPFPMNQNTTMSPNKKT